MIDPDRLAKLRHDLANPLAGLLAEVQLVLLDGAGLTEELKTSLQEMEKLAIRMRTILREVQ
ncbi:MAG: histidine kinase dimerization/phospho-acceptor domain-containing protein [Gemmatimonadales bacterium]